MYGTAGPFFATILSILLSCELSGSGAVAEVPQSDPTNVITYVSADLGHAASFSSDRATLGAPPGLLAIWPSSPVRYFTSEDNIQCASVGSSGDSIEYAIKRPLKQGEKYTCISSIFRIVKCFWYCKSAVIEVSHRLGGNRSGYLKSFIYADSCSGVLAFSQNGDLAKRIPLDAEWVRGPIGILANKTYPKCRSF
jgi:hypothetical protein